MKPFLSLAAIATALGVSAAAATEFPSFERSGFPITPHQVAVLGASDVQEQSASATLMLGGMPASPSQIAILTPRHITTARTSTATMTVGLAAH